MGQAPAGQERREHSTLRQRVWLVVLLGALSAFGPLSIDMYLPGLPALTRVFGVSDSTAQLTLSSCLLGLALGQTLAGPLSDTFGRRRPLLIGLAAYALASLLCAAAPSIGVLIILRFIQGSAGAAGIVIARAVVRDLRSGIALARFFSLLMLINGLAPILAPILGGQILRFTSWRGVFIVLTVIGCLLFLGALLGLAETLSADDRQHGGVLTTLRVFHRLLVHPSFMAFALCAGFVFAAMFTYISGSSFVLQGIYGASPQVFSLIFATNALGIMLAGQINAWLVSCVPIQRMLLIGLSMSTCGGLFLLFIVSFHIPGLVYIWIALFLVVASIGFVSPNASALALSAQGRTAGSASALLGVLQYLVGATAAPFAGFGGSRTALPMALTIALLSLAGAFIYLAKARAAASTLMVHSGS